jgi:hypothetical protein
VALASVVPYSTSIFSDLHPVAVDLPSSTTVRFSAETTPWLANLEPAGCALLRSPPISFHLRPSPIMGLPELVETLWWFDMEFVTVSLRNKLLISWEELVRYFGESQCRAPKARA